MKYTLEKLEVYLLAESFSDEVWNLVQKWDLFIKDTIGKQLVRAADSISANIAEGYGRYYFKESKQFYFYSRGSVQETKAWLSKCNRRKIMPEDVCERLIDHTEKILATLNAFIKFVAKSQEANLKSHGNKSQITN